MPKRLQNMRDEIMASIGAECGDVATTEDIEDLAHKLEQIQNAQADTVSEALGVEDSEHTREIINRIDDLQSQLPKDVAHEVQR